MRRIAILVAAVALAVATATMLVAVAVTLPTNPGSAGAAATTTTRAREFFAAVDDILRTGDAAALAAVVAADYVDHAQSATEVVGRDALVRDLQDLRASFTGLDVIAEDLIVDGDRVAARVTFRGTRRGDFLGILLGPAPSTWQELDLLRVSGGKVAERWHAGDPVGRFALLAQATLDRAPVRPIVALARFTYAPGAQVGGPLLPGPGMLVVESGSLTLPGTGAAGIVGAADGGEPAVPTPIPLGASATVRAGGAVVVAQATSAARNDGRVPAVALGLALFPPPDSESFARGLMTRNGEATAAGALALAMVGPEAEGAALPPGLSIQPLAAAVATALAPGPLAVGLGRATLPPGESLPAHRVPGLELYVVEAGTLGGAAGPAAADPPTVEAGPMDPASPIALESGGVAMIQAGTAGPVRGTGVAPVTFLLAVIAPAPTTDAPAA